MAMPSSSQEKTQQAQGNGKWESYDLDDYVFFHGSVLTTSVVHEGTAGTGYANHSTDEVVVEARKQATLGMPKMPCGGSRCAGAENCFTGLAVTDREQRALLWQAKNGSQLFAVGRLVREAPAVPPACLQPLRREGDVANTTTECAPPLSQAYTRSS